MTERDEHPEFTTIWKCDPPTYGSKFKVIEDEWDHTTNPPTRIIKRAEFAYLTVVADDPDPSKGVYPITKPR